MANEQVQLRRGTTAENDNFVGAEGELVYDTEKKQLRIHDGERVGGFIVSDMFKKFGKTQPELVNIMQTDSPSGGSNIELTQSFKNFDYIMIVAGGDTDYLITQIYPSWYLDFMFNQTYSTSFDLLHGWVYWMIYNYSNGSTETFWKLRTENSRMFAIYGFNVN